MKKERKKERKKKNLEKKKKKKLTKKKNKKLPIQTYKQYMKIAPLQVKFLRTTPKIK